MFASELVTHVQYRAFHLGRMALKVLIAHVNLRVSEEHIILHMGFGWRRSLL
jgi:hypothetical protein